MGVRFRRRPALSQQVLWLIIIYCLSVTALSAVAYGLKLVMKAAGLAQ